MDVMFFNIYEYDLQVKVRFGAADLRKPMKTGRGMKKVDVIIWKEPSIKISWCCTYEAFFKILSFFLLYRLVEIRKELEDCIEIIFKKIIEINLKYRFSMVELQANFVDDVQNIRDDDKCIWS